MEDVDYIIVGQGIAGSLLAYESMGRGFRVKIVDDAHRSSSSSVAAGILNPVTGLRLVKSPELEKFLPVAKRYYQDLEAQLGVRFFNQCEILRLFKNDYEISQYQKRKLEEDYAKYLGERFEGSTFGEVLQDTHGSFVIKEAANLDTKSFLSALREFFKTNDVLLEERFDYQAIVFEDIHVLYNTIKAKKIIFCEGYKVIENPWFKHLKWELAKGEILTLKIQDQLPNKIINCGKWLMPISNGIYKAGASYDWDHFDNQPTATAREEILKDLRSNLLVNNDELEVLDQEAGVRPCTKDTKPYIGLHEHHNCLVLFNGFGSKATLLVPYYASQFADFLEKGMALDRDVLISRG